MNLLQFFFTCVLTSSMFHVLLEPWLQVKFCLQHVHFLFFLFSPPISDVDGGLSLMVRVEIVSDLTFGRYFSLYLSFSLRCKLLCIHIHVINICLILSLWIYPTICIHFSALSKHIKIKVFPIIMARNSDDQFWHLSSLGIKIYIHIKLSRKCLQISWCRGVRVSGSCWDSNIKILGFPLTGGKWWPIEILPQPAVDSLSQLSTSLQKRKCWWRPILAPHVVPLNTHWTSLSLSSPTTPEKAHIWLPTECFILNGIFVCLSDILLLGSRQGGVTS